MTQHEFNHLLDSVKTLSAEQLQQLRHELDAKMAAAASSDRQLSEAQQADQDVQRRLFEAGLLSEIKPPYRVATATERFSPVSIQGEPLSETVIRERR